MHAGFYEAVAGSAAAFFGIGAAILATRLVALMERVATLRVERGDLLNRQATPGGNTLETEWAQRARTDELANVYVITRDLWRAIRWALVGAFVTIGVSIAALAEVGVSDSRVLRIAVLGLFLVASLVWFVLLGNMAGDLIDTTEPIYRTQRRQREAATAASEDFLVSGDEEELARTADGAEDRLLEAFPIKLSPWAKLKRRGRRIRRRFVKWRPPRV